MSDHKTAEAALYFVTRSKDSGAQLISKEQLHTALCLAGRNPTLKFIKSVWNGKPIDSSSFSSILSKCETLDEEKLTVAFSKLSPKKKKSISRNQLANILSSCGETLSQNEVERFLDSMRKANPGILDSNGEVMYGSLSQSLVKTATETMQRSLDLYEQSKSSPLKKIVRSRSASGSTRRRRSSISLSKSMEMPSNIEHWVKTSIYGAFFFDDDDDTGIISHQYLLNIPQDTSVYVTIKSTLNQFEDKAQVIDARLLIVSDEENSVMLAGFTHDENNKGEYVCRTELKQGTYTIIPFTTGCRFVRKAEKSPSNLELLNMVNGKPVLLELFLSALKKIFKVMDTDGNNLLSRQEFNLFNWRTSGEEVADDEWAVVQENFELENGELTPNGFLDLHQMEAEDSNGEEDDLWVTLHSMGFNNHLKLHQVCPFEINVYSPEESFKFDVTGIRSRGPAFSKVLSKFVIDNGYSSRIKDLQDLCTHLLSTKTWSCIVLQNKSHSVVKINVDCSESSNCVSHRGQLTYVASVSPKSFVIAHHLMPMFDVKPWKVKFSETIVT